MFISIVYTLIDLYRTTYFDFRSKDSIDFFLESFNWSIISSVFVMFSVYYALQTFKIGYESNLFNSFIAPREKIIDKKLNKIMLTNKQLHNFVEHNSWEIMTKIIFKEKNNHGISNKRRLKIYFDKYIKDEIINFEHSEFYGSNCKGDCSVCSYDGKKVTPRKRGKSFDTFKLICFELFCVSPDYSDYETDLKSLYEINCPENPIINRKTKNVKYRKTLHNISFLQKRKKRNI